MDKGYSHPQTDKSRRISRGFLACFYSQALNTSYFSPDITNTHPEEPGSHQFTRGASKSSLFTPRGSWQRRELSSLPSIPLIASITVITVIKKQSQRNLLPVLELLRNVSVPPQEQEESELRALPALLGWVTPGNGGGAPALSSGQGWNGEMNLFDAGGLD